MSNPSCAARRGSSTNRLLYPLISSDFWILLGHLHFFSEITQRFCWYSVEFRENFEIVEWKIHPRRVESNWGRCRERARAKEWDSIRNYHQGECLSLSSSSGCISSSTLPSPARRTPTRSRWPVWRLHGFGSESIPHSWPSFCRLCVLCTSSRHYRTWAIPFDKLSWASN